MKSLVLALLIALFAVGTANAQSVVATDPADTPASPYDIEGLAVAYDTGSGSVQVTWRFAQPLPVSAPASPDVYVTADVKQGNGYYSPCQSFSAGDVNVRVGHGGSPVDGVWPYRATYSVSGRAGTPEAPLTIAPDRRELTVTVTDAAAAGRTFFCAQASSSAGSAVVSDRRMDTVPHVYFPGFAPAPARLIAPPGVLFRGTTPVLEWEATSLVSAEELQIEREGSTSSASMYLLPTDTEDGFGEFAGTVSRVGANVRYAFNAPLPDGIYTWAVQRSFGALSVQRATGRFEIGPPDLTRLVLTQKIKQPAGAKKAGSAQLTIDATRGASGTLVVKRGSRTVRTARFTVSTDEDGAVESPKVSLKLSCGTPGRYRATVTTADRYGQQLDASRSWTVSKTRCARLERADARKRAVAKRRKAARTKPSADCMGGYSPCLPVVGDLDCGEIPESKKPVTVTGGDPYRLDADDDGVGCE